MTLWLAVTHDDYELPLHVCDSAREMAAWAGIKVESVYQQSSRNRKKGTDNRLCYRGKYRIRCIEVEEENDDE